MLSVLLDNRGQDKSSGKVFFVLIRVFSYIPNSDQYKEMRRLKLEGPYFCIDVVWCRQER